MSIPLNKKYSSYRVEFIINSLSLQAIILGITYTIDL